MIVAPVAGFDQRQDAGPVRARLGTEDPSSGTPLITVCSKIIKRMATYEVEMIGLVKFGNETYGIVEHCYDVRKCVSEEARNAHRNVDSRTAQLRQVDHLEAGHPPRRLIPLRHHTQ